MTFNYNNSHTINNNNYFNSKIMLSAIFSLSFVIILVIILHLYVRCALRPLRRQFASPSAAFIYNHQIRRVEPVPAKTGLDPTVINSLPSFIVNQLDGHDHIIEECTVCLSILENDDVARQLPNCNHVFHVQCIDRWLKDQSTCPICRSEAAPRLKLLDREPTAGGSERLEMVILTSNNSDQDDHSETTNGKVINSQSGPSNNSSSFRLSSFRKIIGIDRSSSSRRIQVNVERDLERQG